MDAVKYDMTDESLLIGLLMSGKAVFVRTIPFFDSNGLTSIALYDPIDQRGITFDISNVRIEEKIENEEEV